LPIFWYENQRYILQASQAKSSDTLVVFFPQLPQFSKLNSIIFFSRASSGLCTKHCQKFPEANAKENFGGAIAKLGCCCCSAVYSTKYFS